MHPLILPASYGPDRALGIGGVRGAHAPSVFWQENLLLHFKSLRHRAPPDFTACYGSGN